MPLTKSRLERLKELVEWIDKTSSAQRKDSLEAFANSHKVSYNTVKKDAEILAYAVTPGFDFRFIPKSLRKEVRGVKKEIRENKINLIDAGSAAYDFIMMNPLSNIERLNRLYPINDLKVKQMQEKIAKFVQWTAEEKAKAGIHPVRAQAQAWLEIGKSIHHEIEEAIKTTPKKDLDKLIKQIWEANFLKAQAELQYEQARVKLIDLLSKEIKEAKEKKEVPVEWEKFLEIRYGKEKVKRMTKKEKIQRLESDYKNIRRHARPGVERALPRELKTALKREKELKNINPNFASIRKNLRMGDKIYKEYIRIAPLRRKRTK